MVHDHVLVDLVQGVLGSGGQNGLSQSGSGVEVVGGVPETCPPAGELVGEDDLVALDVVVGAFDADLIQDTALGGSHELQNGPCSVLVLRVNVDGKAAAFLGDVDGQVGLGFALGGRQDGQGSGITVQAHHLLVVNLDNTTGGTGNDGSLAVVEALLHNVPGQGQEVGIQQALSVQLSVELQLGLLSLRSLGEDPFAVLLHAGAGNAEGMVEESVQLLQVTVHGESVLGTVDFLQFLEEGNVVLGSGIGHQGLIGGDTFQPVGTDNGSGDSGRSQPQQVGIAFHLGNVGLVHQLLDVGGTCDVGSQVFQQALIGQGLVAALEVDDVGIDFTVHDGQRHSGSVAGCGGLNELDVDVVALSSHLLVDGGAQLLNILFIGEDVLADDLDGHGCIGRTDFADFDGVSSGSIGCGSLSLGGFGIAAAGSQGQNHDQSQQQSDQLFHCVSS